jgi:hypothetical protein
MDPASTEALIISKEVFSISCGQKLLSYYMGSYDMGCPNPTQDFFNIWPLRFFFSPGNS